MGVARVVSVLKSPHKDVRGPGLIWDGVLYDLGCLVASTVIVNPTPVG